MVIWRQSYIFKGVEFEWIKNKKGPPTTLL